MSSRSNVNVKMNEVKNVNVNVIKDPNERNMVTYIMRKLGVTSTKDFGYWRKVAQNLTPAQIADAIEIAESKKSGPRQRIKYVTGIFRNMMASGK